MVKRSIIWSERSLNEYQDLIDYLLEEWGEEITVRVIQELDQSIMRIQNSHEQFQIILKRKRVRRCVMSPQTSIFFKVNKDVIEILSLFDNRRDPKKRKL